MNNRPFLDKVIEGEVAQLVALITGSSGAAPCSSDAQLPEPFDGVFTKDPYLSRERSYRYLANAFQACCDAKGRLQSVCFPRPSFTEVLAASRRTLLHFHHRSLP